MRKFNRRELLRNTAVGAVSMGSSTLLSGCVQNPAPSGNEMGADTGPLLPPRIPGSIRDASPAEQDLKLTVISGTMPTDLRGHVFSVASIPDDRDGYVFNGEGMIYRLDFTADAVTLRSRLARTPSYYAAQETAGSEDEFLDAGVLRLSPTLGARNQPNHAVFALGEQLIITSDLGRPYSIDPETLGLIAPLGPIEQWRTAFDASLPSGPFPTILTAAHLGYDANTQELFSVNYSPALPEGKPFTDLLRWNSNGKLQRWKLVDTAGNGVLIKQSVHQVAVTQDFVILADTAFRISTEQFSGNRRTTPQAADTPIYIIRRDALKHDVSEVQALQVDIPRETLHFLVDFDNPQGRITLHAAHPCAWDFSDWLRDDDRLGTVRQPVRRGLRGMPSTPLDIGVLGRHVIDTTTGKLLDSELLQDDEYTWGASLPTVPTIEKNPPFESIFWLSFGFSEEMLTWRTSQLYKKYKYRQIDYTELPILGRPSTLFRLDVPQMEILDGYQFPPGRFATAPQFIPKADSVIAEATNGYLMCVVTSDDTSASGSSGDELWIFDSSQLFLGPLCRLGHPELNMAFVQHSTWLPSLTKPSTINQISVREDFANRLEGQPENVRKMFEEEVFPKFERGNN